MKHGMFRDGTGAWHPSSGLLGGYHGAAELEPDLEWALETHLEHCAPCRIWLAESLEQHDPDTASLVAEVWDGIGAEVSRPRRPRSRPRWLPRAAAWSSPEALHWLGMAVVVVAAGLGLDLLAMPRWTGPSLVLLLAPVTPVIAVAATGVRFAGSPDELLASSPLAGLPRALRRTATVLAVVLPVLLAAGGVAGLPVFHWLLPAFAFAVCTLALGELVGVRVAAVGVLAGWSLLVVAPSVATATVPVVLAAGALPAWGAAVGASLLLLALRPWSVRRALSRY